MFLSIVTILLINLDFYLYLDEYICMKTTLNLPDMMVREAKVQALAEDTTLTDLIIQGLDARLRRGKRPGALPLSTASGGLQPGTDWDHLVAAENADEAYR